MSEGLVLAGRYHLLDQLAVGAMGQVWRAHDDRLDRDVAVKLLRPELADDAGFVDRFRSEARHAASVRHPHVAAVHDYGEDADVRTGGAATAYLVMDLLDGPTLGAVLAEGGPLPEQRVALLLAQVADALAAAHRTGLVHRDVKPANLVLSDERPGDVTVTDFGISRAADAVPVTRTGLVMGTAEYLSPEQARGERATTASDVYSLGVVAHELLTGEPPFTGSSPAEVARAHVQDPPPSLPPSVSPAMRATVARCLVKDPSRRPGADELARRLRAVADGTADGPGDGADRGDADAGPDAWLPDVFDAARPDTHDTAARTTGSATPMAPATPATRATPATPATPPTPATREIPVVGPSEPAAPAPAPRPPQSRPPARPQRRRRWRSPLRAPAVALLALLALLVLVTALRQAGLLDTGGDPTGRGDPAAAGRTATAPAAVQHVTGSPGTTTDEDGR